MIETAEPVTPGPDALASAYVDGPAPVAPAGLARRTVRSLAWSTVATVGGQVVQLVLTAILARLLVPAQFGLVEMYAVFTGFAVVFIDLGLAAALVQRKQLEERHLSSAFWLNLAAGAAAAGLIAALSPAIAAFYGEPRLVLLACVAATNFVLGAPAIVQSALLQRALNFKRLAVVQLLATVIAGVAGVIAAAEGLGVWSLVILTLATNATRSVLLWYSSDWRPKWMIDRSALRELWGFSGSLLGFRAVNYWARNADNLLIGRFIGVATLGLYARAYNTMLLPLNQISNITSNVMFSALSGIQDDLERVRRGYLRAVGMIAVVAFPSMIGLMVVADRFVAVAYGNRWHEAVPLLRILCVAGLAQSIGTTTGWIMQSRGRTDWLFRWGLFLSGITLTGFNIGVHWGAIGVTTSYAAANVLCAYPGFVVICRLIELPMRNLARALYKPLFASAVMGGAIYVVGSALPGSWSPAYGLLLLVVLGGAVYLAGLALLGADALRDILALKQGT